MFVYLGAKIFFSSRFLKTRERYISFAQLVLLSLYIFWEKCVYFSIFEKYTNWAELIYFSLILREWEDRKQIFCTLLILQGKSGKNWNLKNHATKVTKTKKNDVMKMPWAKHYLASFSSFDSFLAGMGIWAYGACW